MWSINSFVAYALISLAGVGATFYVAIVIVVPMPVPNTNIQHTPQAMEEGLVRRCLLYYFQLLKYHFRSLTRSSASF